MTKRTSLRAVFLAALLAVPVVASGQIIENPARPTSPDADRVVKLAEVWRITDEDAASRAAGRPLSGRGSF